MNFPLNHGLHKAGLPLIVVKLFGNDICLMLDTGSNQNIIDESIYEHFKDKLTTSESSGEIIGLNGVSTKKGVKVNLPFTFENQEYEEPFVCSNTTEAFDAIEKESGIRIYGIIGNHFFLEHGWILDFEKIEVYKK